MPRALPTPRRRCPTRGQRAASTTLAEEPALLDLVTQRYLTRGAPHESVLRSTYQSRATYFRRLRRARELLLAAT
ncbi:hypothetical protein [Nocardioides sp. J54]|uniref:hypothetical protein n=1 Tax=Nocardioides sp. J54 TaxID=935866 RepID=UPI0012FB72DC|nr:hypothetical protein [Nocardioides sp. J54]